MDSTKQPQESDKQKYVMDKGNDNSLGTSHGAHNF